LNGVELHDSEDPGEPSRDPFKSSDYRQAQRVNFDSETTERAMETPHETPADPLTDQLVAGQELEGALKQLPPTQQAVLLLDKGHGYTNAEIARMTGLSIHTVKKYTTRAMQRLRGGQKGSSTA
jgi:RNA polymerase sigma factor (sigma-70 family)